MLRQQNCNTRQDVLCVPITFIPALTTPFLQFSFLLSLSSLALEQHPLTQRCYHAATVRSYFHLHLVLPLCLHLSLFNSHHRHPRGRRYYTILRHSLKATNMYIRLPSSSSRRALIQIKKFPHFLSLFAFTRSCAFSLLSATARGTAVRTASADPSLSFISPPPSPAWTTFTPHSHYHRYIRELESLRGKLSN